VAIAAVATGFAVASVLMPVASSQEPSPEEDREQLQQLGSELETTAARLERAQSELNELEAQLAAVTQETSEAQERLAQAQLRLSQQAADLYRTGGRGDALAPLLGDQPPDTFARRMEYLDMVVDSGVDVVQEARQAQQVYDGNLAQMEQLAAQERALVEELDSAAQELDNQFRTVEARVEGFGSVRDGVACPVGEPSTFIDSWGFARSGGRSHQGTDILAPRGIPLFAYTDGVIEDTQNTDSGLAGLYYYLRGDDGNVYFGAHMDTLSVVPGQRVRAGEPIGTNGDTGNARGTPHLHFELHPGGGRPVNPYSLVQAACG
jgi:murein DD-endopeptidase MepM/ murein hydrolase activator NlpD